MTDILYWIGIGLGGFFVAWLAVGFWRGLSNRPTDNPSPPSDQGGHPSV
jgi:hypothetical protein